MEKIVCHDAERSDVTQHYQSGQTLTTSLVGESHRHRMTAFEHGRKAAEWPTRQRLGTTSIDRAKRSFLIFSFETCRSAIGPVSNIQSSIIRFISRLRPHSVLMRTRPICPKADRRMAQRRSAGSPATISRSSIAASL